ncbi:DUF4862 family protein [Buttiauxella selenatireducens]|uniref:DUF4862 family protein n=1 Tax=Buttiauxella selenatireducens TaxID=3073902 RepID=A0ABY9SF34_9ENTR|nr:DUF4862 family protein [Buttiauxella sp. R73]WMY75761.1 DUF4862 family protein [Buttiauxella sp. R73]
MKENNAGFIIGAYPCAPSFHQQGEEQETLFWRTLADVPGIRGLEQPCLENLHPYGDEYLFKHTPDDWQIVVTAIMETMRRRGTNGGFGLASSDEAQRKSCVDYYRHIWEKINRTNDRFGKQKVIALELQAAPLVGETDVSSMAECFARSLAELQSWDWSCELVVEHCDAMTQPAARKGFLPLEEELKAITDRNVGMCINWARSAIEGRNTTLPLAHAKQCQQAGKLSALMFSGTAPHGEYGEWQDSHAPFAPFTGSEAGCIDSLLTVERARDMLKGISPASLSFIGIKLLEINPMASVEHRVAILKEGVAALRSALNSTLT